MKVIIPHVCNNTKKSPRNQNLYNFRVEIALNVTKEYTKKPIKTDLKLSIHNFL